MTKPVMTFLAELYVGLKIRPASEAVELYFAAEQAGSIAVTIPAAQIARLLDDILVQSEKDAWLHALLSKRF
jgi:hypothetical protein